MSRDELIAFARWLLKDEVGEGHEEEIVDQFLQEMTGPRECVEDVAGLRIRSDMPPVEQAQIKIRRVLALIRTMGDIRTRLLT